MATLIGTAGNDTLQGTAQDDTVWGGTGWDVWLLASLSRWYRFALDAQGHWVVTGGQGTDTLHSVEAVQFADALITLGQGQAPVAPVLASGQVLSAPATTALADGGYVLTWTELTAGGTDVLAQRLSASGTALSGPSRVNSTRTGNQEQASAAALADGGYVITWIANPQDGDGWGIVAQRFDAQDAPVGGETVVNNHTANQQFNPVVAGLVGGGYVLSWMSLAQDGSGYGIYAQRYGANGVAQGAQVQVNSYTASDQYFPALTALADGGYLITWASQGQDGDQAGIYAQRWSKAGVAQGGEFRVNTSTLGTQHFPDVSALADGGYLVCWTSLGQDGSGFGIFAQRYSASGAALGGEFQVNTHTVNHQEQPAVAALADGGWVVAWVSLAQDGSGAGIYAQRYSAAGTALGPETRVHTSALGEQDQPAIAALADGGYLISWATTGAGDATGGDGIFAQRFDASGWAVGSGNTLQGDGGDNSLHFEGHASVRLLGAEGNDWLAGGTGSDWLDGGSGRDTLVGGGGDDRYSVDERRDSVIEEGGGGTDTVLASVTYALGEHLEHLTLSGSSALNGSGNALGNTLTGNAAANQLSGGAGADHLLGQAGNDSLSGGAGSDWLDGGSGQDTFVFDSPLSATEWDSIAFLVPDEDHIALSRKIFTGLKGTGPLPATAFQTGSTALEADDRVIYDPATGALVYDPDGTGAAPLVQFAALVGVAGPLTAAHFLVLG